MSIVEKILYIFMIAIILGMSIAIIVLGFAGSGYKKSSTNLLQQKEILIDVDMGIE